MRLQSRGLLRDRPFRDVPEGIARVAGGFEALEPLIVDKNGVRGPEIHHWHIFIENLGDLEIDLPALRGIGEGLPLVEKGIRLRVRVSEAIRSCRGDVAGGEELRGVVRVRTENAATEGGSPAISMTASGTTSGYTTEPNARQMRCDA